MYRNTSYHRSQLLIFLLTAVMTNEELYDRMRQQRILREELRAKTRELEGMMLKVNSRPSVKTPYFFALDQLRHMYFKIIS